MSPHDDADLLQLARSLLSGGDGAQSPLDALDLSDPQQRRFGDYELIERIGRGGMGVVFRARQLGLDREVALKVIANAGDDADAAARLLAEARAAAQLHHPNIVPVYDVGVVDDVHFFSMPLLRGTTLAHTLAGRTLPEAEAIALLLTLCGAVAYAHSLGLLHLDLKPANVLLDDEGRPLVGDFGLARAYDAALGAQAGEASGTPAYMAPEQIDPRLGALSPRSDVHALGAMLHDMLTGLPPHGEGDATTLLGRALAGTPRGPRAFEPRLGADIDAICRCCLQRDPLRRYASVEALAVDLARCRDGNAVSVRARHWPERARRSLRRHPALSLAVATALLALLLGLLGIAWQWQRAESALRVAEHERATSSLRAERLRQLAGLLAASFPAADTDDTEVRHSARAAIAWLAREAGSDATAQRELLDAFGEALRSAGKGEAVDILLDEIIRQRGDGYRREQLAALLARGDRDSLVALQLLAVDQPDAASRELAARGAAELLRAHADDAGALYALALGCSLQSIACVADDYAARLVAAAPDNAVHWILAPPDEPAARTRQRLHHAAQATQFDDHLAAQAALLRTTLGRTPPPDSLRQPLLGMLDDAEILPSLRRRAIDAAPLPRYAAVVVLCRPDRAPARDDPALRADCSTFARRAFQAPGASILSRMIASVMLRRLHKGSAIGREAYQFRRQYVWLSDEFARRRIDPELLQGDLARYGEWEAWLRAADRAGIARVPDPAWQPQNPQTLLLSEERGAAPR